jgi:DNA-binding beta-propeller fold protein YncE
MKNPPKVSIPVICSWLCLVVCQAQTSPQNDPLKLAATIPLPNVSGRIDHLAYDSRNQIVFVAALGNNTVEVVDLKSKKVIHTIKNLHEPQGIKYIPENNVIFVANGENGECDIYNADTYQLITSIKMEGDADNVRYDPSSGRIFVGYGDGAIAIIDAKTYKQLSEIKLPGHPESFQMDANSKRIFVNVPDATMIVNLDVEKKSITDKWIMENATANFPMAFDSKNHRLFIGCRNPAKLLVINSETGKIVAQTDISSDTDDIFYDASSKQIFISCGGGYIDVVSQIDKDNYKTISIVESRSGARTSLFVPELNQLIVAAPTRGGSDAQLMIYEKQ